MPRSKSTKKSSKKLPLNIIRMSEPALATHLIMKSKIKVLSDIILARILPEEEKTKHGIILLPQAKQDEYERKGVRIFEVVAHGPGRVDKNGKLIPIELKKGDRFILDNFTTVEHDYMGDRCIFTREKDILGVLE